MRALGSAIVALPHLERENAQLRSRNRRLTEENARLHELAAAYAAEAAVRPVVDLYHGIEARVIGFPPENESRAVTIDRGSQAGVRRDDGVLAAHGVVGRVAAVFPFSSTVVLATDYTSRIPAVVQARPLVGDRARQYRRASSSSTFRKTRRCASATSSLPGKADRSTPACRSVR